MSIYVASSWRNLYQPNIVALLRSAGHDVYDFRHPVDGDNGFHWSAIDPEWEDWAPQAYREALRHPVAQDGFRKDYRAMRAADMCVVVLPSGRSSHLEAGWFIGAGKPVIIYIPEPVEPELMYLLASGDPGKAIACDEGELLKRVESMGPITWSPSRSSHA